MNSRITLQGNQISWTWRSSRHINTTFWVSGLGLPVLVMALPTYLVGVDLGWMLLHTLRSPLSLIYNPALALWLGAATFAAAVLYMVAATRVNSTTLTTDAKGIRVHEGPLWWFGRRNVPWPKAARFGLVKSRNRRNGVSTYAVTADGVRVVDMLDSEEEAREIATALERTRPT